MSGETTEQDIRSLEWCKSLLCWINSFENISSQQPLTYISDLTNSTLLIECILAATPDKSALPDSLQKDSAVKSLQFDTSNIVLHESNFSKILATFTWFFDIPMDQAISLPGLLSGCEEEFVKLLLIFLAYAVQQKPNEPIIHKILNLDIDVQVTLGKLIEEMFKKLGGKQIETIRDLVLSIDMEFSPSLGATIEESGNLMITEIPDTDTMETVTPPLHASPDPLPLDNPDVTHLSPLYDTPVLAIRCHQDSLFGVTERYYGFDSPAALKWINQPEIKRSLRRPGNTRHTPAKAHELCQLQHMVSQQQEEIHVLRKFCQEKESELIESLEKLQESEIGCRELSATRGKVSDLQDEKVALHQQTELLGKENESLQKEVRALSGYKDRCEHLQDMSAELASTAKGYQMLLMNGEKLQLKLTSEKDRTFHLETEKSSVEQTVLKLQASSEILGQRKQQLEEELEQVRDRVTQLEADLSALKKSKVEDVVVLDDDGERMSERSDEIGLLFKIKLLEEEINELREILPTASERDQLEVALERVTSDLEVMQRGREDLCKWYSEAKADALRLEGKVVELGKYKNQLEASKETVASLSKENSALNLDLHSQTSTHTTLSNENQRLELCLDQAGREKEMLKRQVTELDTTVLSIQDTYNELFCLKEKLILDNDTMDKEVLELRSYKNLLQEREARASKELNSIISQRNDERIQLSSKMSALQEKNSVMQSELKSLELKLSTAVSERSAKEETIATLNEVSKKRVCELNAELETATKSNSEFQKELHHVKCELGSLQGELEISNMRFERKAEQLKQETSDFKECKKSLETNLEQVEKQLSSRATVLQNTIDGLRADTLGLARSNQTLQQEKQKLALMVKEYEAMQEDNTSSVLEELEESKNRNKALEEILDDVECERNSLHSQIRSLNVQLQFAENQLKVEQNSSKIELNRATKGGYRTEREAPNVDTSQQSKWGLHSSRIPGHSSSSTPVCSIEPLQSTKQTNEPKKDSLNRTHEIKRRNAQTLPHLKSSYPIEFQTSTLSERYLQSESPNTDPAYQQPKLGPVLNFLAENPAKKTALAFEIDVGSSSDANKQTRTNPKSLPRVLRGNKCKFSQTNSSTTKKRKT